MFVYAFDEWQFCGTIEEKFLENFLEMQKNLDHVKDVKFIELPPVA
jgi:hypothetical protein